MGAKECRPGAQCGSGRERAGDGGGMICKPSAQSSLKRKKKWDTVGRKCGPGAQCSPGRDKDGDDGMCTFSGLIHY